MNPLDQSMNSSMSGSSDAPRRRSTRDIKRPKFDDEIVESTPPTNKTTMKLVGGRLEVVAGDSPKDRSPIGSSYSPTLNAPSTTPSLTESPLASPNNTSGVVVARRGGKGKPKVSSPGGKTPLSRGTSTSTPSSSSGKMPNHVPPTHAVSLVARSGAVDDMGRWSPHDDVLLVSAVTQSNDLRKVHASTRFGQPFTVEQISYRWYALLYDPTISKLSVDAMRSLSRDTIRDLQSRTPFSKREEAVLATVPSLSQHVSVFDTMLVKHAADGTFAESRTGRALMLHWQHMRHYRLLDDQRTTVWPTLSPFDTTFAEIEESLDVEPDPTLVDTIVESETLIAQRRINREIRMIETQLPKWNVLTESVVGSAPPDFDAQTIGVLRGRLVRYMIRAQEVVLGRANKRTNVDVDLSLEGPAWKLSRKQATIKQRPNGDFTIANDGRATIFVDGQPVLTGQRRALGNNQVLEIGHVRLVFTVNAETQTHNRMEATRLMLSQ